MSARVFVFDDNEASRLEARAAISAAGLEFAGDSEGGSSEAMLAASKSLPDAVLVGLDPAAPEFDRVASALAHLPGTPVVVYSTATDDLAFAPPSIAGGAAMSVPFEAEQLRRAIGAALEASKQTAPGDESAPDAEATGAVIAVYSSKGGAGKTTLALNLAVGLRLASQQPVALVAAPDDPG